MEIQAGALAVRSFGPDARTHLHLDHHQLVLPREGAQEMEVQGRGGRVDAACAVFVQAGERHVFRATEPGPNCFVVLDIDQTTLDALGDDALAAVDALGQRTFFPVTPCVRHLLGYLEGRLSAPATSRPVVLPPPLVTSWTGLLFGAIGADLLERTARDRSDLALARAKDFIARAHARPVTVTDIAREAGVSVSRLHALFQGRLGQTPREHLARVRLNRALDLLADPRLAIAEVAARTGFADQSALTRQMGAVLAVTPGAYRRSLVMGNRESLPS